MSHCVKDYTHLLGMKGLSEKLLRNHFVLYQDSAKNMENIAEKKQRTRGLSWEFDDIRLHELYFENLGGQGRINWELPLVKKLAEDFGSYEAWQEDFKATASIPSIGWAVLCQDHETGVLNNLWIDEHHMGRSIEGKPLVVLDAWEHAYMLDYGFKRGEYISFFLESINWDVVAKRYTV